jgi:hypothetical protein
MFSPKGDWLLKASVTLHERYFHGRTYSHDRVFGTFQCPDGAVVGADVGMVGADAPAALVFK